MSKLSNQKWKLKLWGANFFLLLLLQNDSNMLLFIWEWIFTLVPTRYTMVSLKLPIEIHVLPLWRVALTRLSPTAGSGIHYTDVIMSVMASQITNFKIVYSNVYLGAGKRKHQSSTSLAFVRGIHRSPVNSLEKGPVTRKMFPFDDVIMQRPKGCKFKYHIWQHKFVWKIAVYKLSLCPCTSSPR